MTKWCRHIIFIIIVALLFDHTTVWLVQSRCHRRRIMVQNGGVFTCPSALSYRTFGALLLTAVLVLTILSYILSPTMFRLQLARSSLPEWLNGSANIEAKPTGWLVDTPSCRIPDFDAYNPSMSLYVRNPSLNFIVCNHSLPITVTDRQYVRLNTTLARSLNIQRCLCQQVWILLYATVFFFAF